MSSAATGFTLNPGVELLLDVELEAALRFGCCEMPLGEILELGPGDVIEFDALIFANFAAVQAASAQVGNNVIITKDVSNSITIENVQLANLNADDFMFV